MRASQDKLKKRIFDILIKANQPLETKEVELILKSATRTKVLYRLNDLRGETKIQGKPVGSGKGTWIWWVNKYLEENEK